MLKYSILLAGLVLTSAGDTVWWRNDAGAVTEHKGGGTATCTLQVHNDHGQVAFVWDRELPPRVTVTQADWRLRPDTVTSVSLRIGGTWVAGGSGTQAIMALTSPSALNFVLNQPVDDLLSSADHIAVQAGSLQFAAKVQPAQMRSLVVGLRKCQTAITR
jgi:hypothetical protein